MNYMFVLTINYLNFLCQQPAPVKPQKRTKAATKNTSNQEDSEPSSRALQVPAKNRQSSSGGRMIIKENEPERQSFTDQVINATGKILIIDNHN